MKPIPNCAGYFVNEIGECFSCVKKISGVNGKRGTYTIIDESSPVKLKPRTHTSNGYVYIGLGKYRKKRLHRVVAEAFIPNPNDYPEINHIDEDKENNCVTNLEWCTRQQNAQHSLSKHYVVENVETEERIEIFNLSAFCRSHGLHVGSLHDTMKQRQGRKQHKGWKLLKLS